MTEKLRAIVEGRRCDCGCGCIVEFPTNAEKVLAQALIDVLEKCDCIANQSSHARYIRSLIHTKLKEIE